MNLIKIITVILCLIAGIIYARWKIRQRARLRIKKDPIDIGLGWLRASYKKKEVEGIKKCSLI